MKRKIIYLLGFLALIIPTSVNATEGHEVAINCDKTQLKPSETTLCRIVGNSEREFTAISGYLKWGDNIEVTEARFSDEEHEDEWEMKSAGPDGVDGNLEKDIKFTGLHKETVSGEYTIGSFKITASEHISGANTKLIFREVVFVEFTEQKDDQKRVPIEDVEQNIRIMSTINTLDNIKIDDVAVTGFSKDKTSYDITVSSDKTSIAISADKTNTSSTVTGDIGTKTLNYGINTFSIKVTSESGTSKTYTLKINRPDNRSGEKYILNFEFKGLDIGFDKSITKYNTKIDNKYQQLAFCVGNYKIDTPNILCINSGTISISDKARDEVYIYNSVDLDKMYDEIYTKGEGKCNDEETECSYIYNGKEYIKFYYDPTTDEEFGYFIVGDLKEGSNQLVITIKAENETTQDYTFTLNRLNAKGEDVSGKITNPDTNTSSYILITFMLLGVGLILYKKYKKPIYR